MSQVTLLIVTDHAKALCSLGLLFGYLSTYGARTSRHAKLIHAVRVKLRDCNVKLVTIVDSTWLDLWQIDIIVVQVQVIEARNLDLFGFGLRRGRILVIVRSRIFICGVLVLLLIWRIASFFVVV